MTVSHQFYKSNTSVQENLTTGFPMSHQWDSHSSRKLCCWTLSAVSNLP